MAVKYNDSLLKAKDVKRYSKCNIISNEKETPRYINTPPPLPSQVNRLLFYSFPFVNEGDYKVRFNYYLPGESTPNSSYIIKTMLDFRD